MEEKKKKNIIIIALLIIITIIILVAVVIFLMNNIKKGKISERSSNNNELINKNLTSIEKYNLKNGYYVKIKDNFYTFPEKDEITIINPYGKETFFGSTVYIFDESKLPTFNFNNNDIELIYQGENMPNIKLYKISANKKVVGITLDKDKKVTKILSKDIPEEVKGYTCELIENNDYRLEEGEIVVNDNVKNIKLVFSKGTYRKEITINHFLNAGTLVNAYVEYNDSYFNELELTNENYAKVIINKEKQLTDGYYCIDGYGIDKYYFKIEQGVSNSNAIADEKMQIELYPQEVAIRLVAEASTYNSYNYFNNKLFANTVIYKPIYSDYKEPLEEYSVYPKKGKIIGVNGATTLSKDYYGLPYSMSGSIVLDNQRYIEGKLEFSDTYVSKEKYSIEYLMKVEDYKNYLDNLLKYCDVNKVLDSTKAINSISFEDFKGFITTYSISEGKTIGDVKYRYGIKEIE